MKKIRLIVIIAGALVLASCQKEDKTDYMNDEGIEINGIVWATRNVGAPGKFAKTPNDFGMLYQWNSMVGWSCTNPIKSIPSNSEFIWGSEADPSLKWEWINDPCPDGWRVPTRLELFSLFNKNSKYAYREADGRNWKISGLFFGDNAGKATTEDLKGCLFIVFLDVIRYGTYGELTPYHCCYWSSDGAPEYNGEAYYIDLSVFKEDPQFREYAQNKKYAFPVRCVKDN